MFTIAPMSAPESLAGPSSDPDNISAAGQPVEETASSHSDTGNQSGKRTRDESARKMNVSAINNVYTTFKSCMLYRQS